MYLLYSTKHNPSLKFKQYVEKNNLPFHFLDICNKDVCLFAKKNSITTIPTIMSENGDIMTGKNCVEYTQKYITLLKKQTHTYQNDSQMYAPIDAVMWTPDASRNYSEEELKELMRPKHRMFSGKGLIGNIIKDLKPITDLNRKPTDEEVMRIKKPNKRIIPRIGLNGAPIQQTDTQDNKNIFPSIKLPTINKQSESEKRMSYLLKERQSQDIQYSYK